MSKSCLQKSAELHFKIASLKTSIPSAELCVGVHPVFKDFLDAVMELPYEGMPQHNDYISMFAPLAATLKPRNRPITITAPQQVCVWFLGNN